MIWPYGWPSRKPPVKKPISSPSWRGNSSSDSASTERRREHRLRSYLGGQIAFNHRRSTMDCLVRNVSGGGARLAFPGPVTIPDEFDLHIPHREERHRVRVVWRGEDELGVGFVRGAPPAAVSLDQAGRLRALEAENAALRERLSDQVPA